MTTTQWRRFPACTCRKAKPQGVTVQAGDVIVCNWTSYADVMYLAYAFGPVFAIPSPELAEGTDYHVASK